jgi:hypothetical protein
MTDLTNQEKLEEIYKLVHENNTILHKMQTRDRIAYIFRVIYWLIIVGSLAGAYYYVRPFFDSIQANNTKAEGLINQFEQLRSQFPEAKAFQDILNQFRRRSDTGTSTQ